MHVACAYSNFMRVFIVAVQPLAFRRLHFSFLPNLKAPAKGSPLRAATNFNCPNRLSHHHHHPVVENRHGSFRSGPQCVTAVENEGGGQSV